jgi:NAD-dependent deacetylase
VYPAASLVHFAPAQIPKYIIDPNIPQVSGISNLTPIPLGASEGLAALREMLGKS